MKLQLHRAWTETPLLTFTTFLMLAAFPISLAGIFLDDRIITGAPAWLKPAKFAISSAIYSATIAWLLQYITVWPRFVRAMGRGIALSLIIEVAIIDLQAARGATSHFNVATPLDAVLFGVMGSFIAVLWLASLGVLAALFRQRFDDAAWGWALRLGMLISVLGSATGGMMLRMSADQANAIRSGHQPTSVGGHTVGAPDGGAGLPGVGWSTEHGDVRIPHFFGLHGVQVVPLLGWLALRRRPRNVRAIFTLAAAYLAFIAILTWQALRGQSILRPDEATLAAAAIWVAATAAGIALSWNARQGRAAAHATVLV